MKPRTTPPPPPPLTTTTTEVISWQWPCGAACKMVRQVTTTCPHGCHGAPSARNPPALHHHHPHHQQQGTTKKALATEQSNAAGRRIALLPPPPPSAAAVVAPEPWVAEPGVMVQQLRELEPLLGDEAVALRVQLEEYTEEIERSKRESARTGRDWFLALPANVRDVLELARDAINSLTAFPIPPPAN
ncbi:hypothetical protein ACP4OV_030547 [Aristida adscensionis]